MDFGDRVREGCDRGGVGCEIVGFVFLVELLADSADCDFSVGDVGAEVVSGIAGDGVGV